MRASSSDAFPETILFRASVILSGICLSRRVSLFEYAGVLFAFCESFTGAVQFLELQLAPFANRAVQGGVLPAVNREITARDLQIAQKHRAVIARVLSK